MAKRMGPLRSNLRCAWLRLRRDRFLASMIGMMVLMGLAIRGLLSALQEPLLREYQFDLRSYEPLIASYFGLLTPALIGGCVAGFLILESKEEGPLLAIKVARRARAWMLSATLSYAVLISLALSGIMVSLMGLGIPSLGFVGPVIAINAVASTIFALILCIWSDNKVQAFAITKLTSSMALVPVVAYFADPSWRFFAGFLPFYWICDVWWAAAEARPVVTSLGAALGSTLFWVAGLLWIGIKKL